jgi:hypothetical protein
MVNEIGDYPHLLPHVRVLAAAVAEERILSLSGGHCWIGYPRAQAAITRLESLFAEPPSLRPHNMLVVGPSNNGKSMIAERFRRLHPSYTSPDSHHEVIPVLVMQMPASPTIRRFYAAVLSALGSPLTTYSATDVREQMALRLMQKVGLRLLVIDELHNVLSGKTGQQREVLNVLRYIGNELRLPIACLGTREAYLAIRSDDQLENRFEPFPLPRWDNDADLGRLLASFEAILPLREPSDLSSPALRALILRRSEGTIGEISMLLNAAARLALSMGRERIDTTIIAEVSYHPPSERRRLFEASMS